MTESDDGSIRRNIFSSLRQHSEGDRLVEELPGIGKIPSSDAYCGWDRELTALPRPEDDTIVLTGARGVGKSIALRAAVADVNQRANSERAVYLDCHKFHRQIDFYRGLQPGYLSGEELRDDARDRNLETLASLIVVAQSLEASGPPFDGDDWRASSFSSASLIGLARNRATLNALLKGDDRADGSTARATSGRGAAAWLQAIADLIRPIFRLGTLAGKAARLRQYLAGPDQLVKDYFGAAGLRSIRHLYFFLDDFSEVPETIQSAIVQFSRHLVLSGNWREIGVEAVYKRIAVYPRDEPKVAFLAGERSKVFGVSLFKARNDAGGLIASSMAAAGSNVAAILHSRAGAYGIPDAQHLFDDSFGKSPEDYAFLARVSGGSVRRLGELLYEVAANGEVTKGRVLHQAELFWSERWQRLRTDNTRLPVMARHLLEHSSSGHQYQGALEISQLVIGRRFLVADDKLLEDLKHLISLGFLYLLFKEGGGLGDATGILGAVGINYHLVGINDGFASILHLCPRSELLSPAEFDDPTAKQASDSLQHLNRIRQLLAEPQRPDRGAMRGSW